MSAPARKEPTMQPQIFGDYKVTECRSLGSGEQFWQVHRNKVLDPISQHDTARAAVSAAHRYQKADERRRFVSAYAQTLNTRAKSQP